jgi:hypothetical protein
VVPRQGKVKGSTFVEFPFSPSASAVPMNDPAHIRQANPGRRAGHASDNELAIIGNDDPSIGELDGTRGGLKHQALRTKPLFLPVVAAAAKKSPTVKTNVAWRGELLAAITSFQEILRLNWD